MESNISRRTFLGAAVATPLLAGGLTSCAAPAASWLVPLATSFAAGVAVDLVNRGVEQVIEWVNNVEARLPRDAPDWSPLYWQSDAPVMLVGFYDTGAPDAQNDRLAAYIAGGAVDPITFDAWAWHTLAMACKERTAGKSGGGLDEERINLGKGLAPKAAGVVIPDHTPANTSQSITYQTTSGWVELVRTGDSAQITAFGMTDGGSPNFQRMYKHVDYETA